MPQIHRLIIYHLTLCTRDKSSQPETDDQPPLSLHTNPLPTVLPRPAKSLFNPPLYRKRNRDKRGKLGNKSCRSKRNLLTSTSTRRSPLLHPLMTPFYFVVLPGAVGRDHYRSNREERPPYAHKRKPHLPPMNPHHSPPLVRGVRSI